MKNNNVEQMRSGILEIRKVLHKMYIGEFPIEKHTISAVIGRCDGMSEIPPRNCDVGNAEEQTQRYRRFCTDHKYLGADHSYMCIGFGKGRCPFFSSRTKSQCEFAWAQSPYESEKPNAHLKD